MRYTHIFIFLYIKNGVFNVQRCKILELIINKYNINKYNKILNVSPYSSAVQSHIYSLDNMWNTATNNYINYKKDIKKIENAIKTRNYSAFPGANINKDTSITLIENLKITEKYMKDEIENIETNKNNIFYVSKDTDNIIKRKSSLKRQSNDESIYDLEEQSTTLIENIAQTNFNINEIKFMIRTRKIKKIDMNFDKIPDYIKSSYFSDRISSEDMSDENSNNNSENSSECNSELDCDDNSEIYYDSNDDDLNFDFDIDDNV